MKNRQWLFHHWFWGWQLWDALTGYYGTFPLLWHTLKRTWKSRKCIRLNRYSFPPFGPIKYYWFCHDFEEGRPLDYTWDAYGEEPSRLFQRMQAKCRICGTLGEFTGYSDSHWASMFDETSEFFKGPST